MPVSIGTTTVTALFLGTTSITSAYLGATQVFGGSFTPLSLFSGGAQGIWLDPSDLSTMFSDRAGTIPVTTPGTVVGKRLDKSGRGNHAIAPTDAARPIYGVEPKGGRRNLLTWSEDFGNAVWVKTNLAVSSGVSDPNGGTSAFTVTATGANGDLYQSRVSSNVNHKNSIWVRRRTGTGVIQIRGPQGQTNENITVTSEWQRFTSNAGLPFQGIDAYTGIKVLTAGDAVDIWGAQLELGSTATAYQRVTNDYDVTEAGVVSCHYCRYDGFNSSMSTAAIDFTATDKMSVFAGVRKLSDAAQGVVVELSATVASNNGSFLLAAPDGATATFGFDSKGTALVDAIASSLTAPISRIVTGLADIAGDRATIRIDGVQADQDTGDQGTGNFGNYPLFIGRRNSATLPFNGRDYGIVIVGKTASAGEISDTETWLAARTSGVTI